MPTRKLKALVFIVCLGPATLLVLDSFSGGLGVNPIEDITHRTGNWALRCLLATLAITPLRWMSGWNEVIRFRRMLGLFAFFYGTLHFLTYLVFDHFFNVVSIFDDVAERNWITAGFVGFVLMLPLAVTSTQGWIRRLGRRWLFLHRLVYVSAIAAIVHFLWLAKIDISEPLFYGAILMVLFGIRLVRRYGWRHA